MKLKHTTQIQKYKNTQIQKYRLITSEYSLISHSEHDYAIGQVGHSLWPGQWMQTH